MTAKRIVKLPYVNFKDFAYILNLNIEKYMGEPQNPDDMLAEGQATWAEMDAKHKDAQGFEITTGRRSDTAEDEAFKKLTLHLSSIKKFVEFVVGPEWFITLDIPSRMPRSREKVREAARAVLAAWDEHSADPELVHVVSAMTDLRAAFDAFVAAWDAQQNARRIKKEKYRAAKEARAKCEKFVSRVKKYLSLHLDPTDPKWELYGFERRGEE